MLHTILDEALSPWKKDTRKIKIVEGMCFITDDIRDTFKNIDGNKNQNLILNGIKYFK